tara:strand:+ start:396 stop:1250 length:855 start_codon:yes stop_codon:yes gene_type:complete
MPKLRVSSGIVRHFRGKLLVISWLACFITSSLSSKVLLEKKGNLVINWTGLQVDFQGAAEGGLKSSWNTLQAASTKKALQDAYDGLQSHFGDRLLLQQQEEQKEPHTASYMVEGITRSAYIVEFQHFPSGKTQAYLQSSLVRAFYRQKDRTAIEKEINLQEEERFTGVLFRCDRAIMPRISCLIKLPADSKSLAQHLGTIENLTKSAARWLVAPTQQEISRYEGLNPLFIKVKCRNNGELNIENQGSILSLLATEKNLFKKAVYSVAVAENKTNKFRSDKLSQP